MKLPTTAQGRLNLYRKRAAESKVGNDWRAQRYERHGTTWHNWSEDRRKIYADERGTLGDYLGDWCSHNGGSRTMRDTTGFYVDDMCHETMQGGVERIRCARGAYYVPVTYCSEWDGCTYWMEGAELVEKGAPECDHDTAAHCAARYAFDRADREAERCRDDFAKDQAEQQIEQERAEIHEINKATRALLAEIRGREFTENVCAALRHRLHEYLADRRRCFRIIKERTENYWSAVGY